MNLFLLQPSREYWGDITSPRESERILRRQPAADADPFQLHLESGNRLLASMGYLGRDFLKLLLDAGDWITDLGTRVQANRCPCRLAAFRSSRSRRN